MADNIMERTLISALIPAGAAHVHTVNSIAVPHDARALVLLQGFMSSLVADFTIRAIPKGDILPPTVARLPYNPKASLDDDLILRVLRLNCIVEGYRDLWGQVAHTLGPAEDWVGGMDHRDREALTNSSVDWNSGAGLRRAADRRQAQVEVDALVALMLGVTADQLCTIYRTQFPVLYGYDRNTYFYDANGRLVPNSVLTVWRKKGDDISPEERTATNASGNTYTYELPFVTLDREADMRQAYAHFEKVPAERGGA